jgi:NAD(P)-dependent dehydrogenase (short-subunit alcohol dehydrogenase family)
MAQELAGKVAIITGGASGIGRASVELFVEEGAKVVIADVDVERGEALAAQLGASVRFKRTDVGDAEQIRALVDTAVTEFGGLHIMFNNAGISGTMREHFLDDELADFQRITGVNLLGVMLGSRDAARHMAKHGGGSIINTSSIAGMQAGYGVMTYRASKAGVIHFTKSIAIDLAEHGIRVNCIAPGHVQSEMTSYKAPGMSAETAEQIKQALIPVTLSNQPIKQLVTVRDVAQAAVFLGSDRSAKITGLVMPVDGGTTVGDPVNHLQDIMNARAQVLAG